MLGGGGEEGSAGRKVGPAGRVGGVPGGLGPLLLALRVEGVSEREEGGEEKGLLARELDGEGVVLPRVGLRRRLEVVLHGRLDHWQKQFSNTNIYKCRQANLKYAPSNNYGILASAVE